ncbi:conserved hypothetical protein [Ricinus communis]|uniref:Uncharacterized protein n=1 Tax=Ricinus communis TaxID=3988 RepID=B9TIF0_RICCO|nr:conserved hypothetical protein [Ricinus communis]
MVHSDPLIASGSGLSSKTPGSPTCGRYLRARNTRSRLVERSIGSSPRRRLTSAVRSSTRRGAHAVQYQHVLLVGSLQCYETHMGTARCFTDGFCVQPVVLYVLAAFAVGGCELRGDQTDFVAEPRVAFGPSSGLLRKLPASPPAQTGPTVPSRERRGSRKACDALDSCPPRGPGTPAACILRMEG